MGDIYGYARVSSTDQNLERQTKELKEFGIPEKYIFSDKASGKNFDRKAYNSLVGTELTLPYLRENDTLVICSLDRLGRNYTEIQKEWRKITQKIKANIVVLDMPILNTTQSDEDNLDRKFLSDLTLKILCYVAEKERKSIESRQKQGIACMPIDEQTGKRVSTKTGRTTGRPPIEFPENWETVYNQWENKEITATAAMEVLGLKRNSFYNLVKRYDGGK